MNILKLQDPHDLQLCVFMYDFVNGNVPGPLKRLFEYHGETHSYATRHHKDPRIPKVLTELAQRSFLLLAKRTKCDFRKYVGQSRLSVCVCVCLSVSLCAL